MSGPYANLGILFPRLRQDCGVGWGAYTDHAFVRRIGDGSLPEAAFRHYLAQDYLFLIHFARAYGLAAYKAEDLEDIRAAAAAVSAIVDVEMGLHVEYCAGWGLSEADMAALPEDPALHGLYPLRARAGPGRRPARPAGGAGALRHRLRRDRPAPGRRSGDRKRRQPLRRLDRHVRRATSIRTSPAPPSPNSTGCPNGWAARPDTPACSRPSGTRPGWRPASGRWGWTPPGNPA